MRTMVAVLLVGAVSGCTVDLTDRVYRRGNVCEVHHCPMEKQKLPVLPGSAVGDTAWLCAHMDKFPHSDGPRYADDHSILWEEWAIDYVCPQCNKARDAWRADHRAGNAEGQGLPPTYGKMYDQ